MNTVKLEEDVQEKQQVGIPVQFSSKTKAPTKRYNLRLCPYQRIDHSLCKNNNDKESLTNESTSKTNIMGGVEGEPDVQNNISVDTIRVQLYMIQTNTQMYQLDKHVHLNEKGQN